MLFLYTFKSSQESANPNDENPQGPRTQWNSYFKENVQAVEFIALGFARLLLFISPLLNGLNTHNTSLPTIRNNFSAV